MYIAPIRAEAIQKGKVMHPKSGTIINYHSVLTKIQRLYKKKKLFFMYRPVLPEIS